MNEGCLGTLLIVTVPSDNVKRLTVQSTTDSCIPGVRTLLASLWRLVSTTGAGSGDEDVSLGRGYFGISAITSISVMNAARVCVDILAVRRILLVPSIAKLGDWLKCACGLLKSASQPNGSLHHSHRPHTGECWPHHPYHGILFCMQLVESSTHSFPAIYTSKQVQQQAFVDSTIILGK